MDQLKLRNLVFEKTGVKIDVDDPVFALVALNEAVLAEAVERHVALLDGATAVLAGYTQALQGGASVGGYSAPERAALIPPQAATNAVAAGLERRMLAGAAGAAVLGAVLVLLGQAMFFTIHPAPPAPPSTIIAKELTPEQAEAIRNGAKLSKIVQKLDPKTRYAIQAEMQKP